MIIDLTTATRINGYIQRRLGTLWLDGKEVQCVALDGTCTLVSARGLIDLTEEQVQDLVNQIRDTQFAGFAKLLWDELVTANDCQYIDIHAGDNEEDSAAYRQIIARRAYDLAEHTLKQAALLMKIIIVTSAYMTYIPDLAEWPKIAD